MEPKFQSSFIPKGPLATSATFQSKVQGPKHSLIGFLSVVVFSISILLSIGVFSYNWYLESSIKKIGASLEEAKQTLNPESIIELTRLNSRLNLTQNLIDNHTTLSPFFDFLEQNTVTAIRFTEFDYTNNDTGGIALTMKGASRGYSAIALQSEIFNNSDFIQDPQFSDLVLDDKGNVTFVFNATIDPSLVSYKDFIEKTTPPVNNSLPTNVSTSTEGVPPSVGAESSVNEQADQSFIDESVDNDASMDVSVDSPNI